jgi:ATP synthase I subunit
MDARARTSLVAVGATGAALALGAFAFFGTRAGLSAAAGAALGAGNLWAWARIVSALLPESPGGARAQSRAAWVLVASFKVLAWIAVAWLLMRHGLVQVASMFVGLLSLPIGIAIGSLVSDRSAVPEDP